MEHRLKIVIADDERDTREYLQEYLSHLGHDVWAVEDGRRLVEACQDRSPDLIVSDYAMPGMDGWTAVQEINRSRPVPVILVSGRHDVVPLALPEGSPVLKVLTKPINRAELRKTVESVQIDIEANARKSS